MDGKVFVAVGTTGKLTVTPTEIIIERTSEHLKALASKSSYRDVARRQVSKEVPLARITKFYFNKPGRIASGHVSFDIEGKSHSAAQPYHENSVAFAPGQEPLFREILEFARTYHRLRRAEDAEIKQAKALRAEAKHTRELEASRQLLEAHRSGELHVADLKGTGSYPRDWDTIRKTVYERDGNKCSNCGTPGIEVTLHAHHIVPLAAGGTNKPTNLITLCAVCHRKVHGV